ncbi:tetratricopeptide repeat protein [Methyloligella solikamskensis]|uniref:Tetratricopeptide repeat protein n=1 Tax=Methyloligella solikamskensis TaxID=1177756 RepID=A0ABW3J8Q5_9HYPH
MSVKPLPDNAHPNNTHHALPLRQANVTPGPLAVLGPGEPGWGVREAPVAERNPEDPLVPLPDRAPFPSPEGVPGQPPAAGQGALPGAGGVPDGMDAEALFSDAEARSQMLDQLYDALASSPDAQAAGRLQDAIETIWLRTGSPTIDVLLERAILMGQAGDYGIALEILNAAISLSPDTAETWHQRAMVHFLRDEHSKALSDLRRTLALDPKHYEAIAGLARVLEHLGQKESALAVYRRALQINPFLEPARLAVEELSREIEGQDI